MKPPGLRRPAARMQAMGSKCRYCGVDAEPGRQWHGPCRAEYDARRRSDMCTFCGKRPQRSGRLCGPCADAPRGYAGYPGPGRAPDAGGVRA